MTDTVGSDPTLDPADFATFAELCRAQLAGCGESPETVGKAIGMKGRCSLRQTLDRGAWPTPLFLDRLVARYGWDPAKVRALRNPARPVRPLTSLALLVQERMQRDGLGAVAAAAHAGLSPLPFRGLRDGAVPGFKTVGHLAAWLGLSPEAALRASGQWERLSPIGRLIGVALVEQCLDVDPAAKRLGVPRRTLNENLRRGTLVRDETLITYSEAFGVDLARLRRAAREIREAMPPRQLAGRPRNVLKRQGREGLRLMGEVLNVQFKRKQRDPNRTDLQPSELGRRAAAASRNWYASITPAERWRVHLAKIRPTLRGAFGICRVCRKMVYQTPPHARGPVEFHRKCMLDWQANDPAYLAWWARVRRGIGNPGIRPSPAYPQGSRPTSDELARFMEVGIRYLHIKRRVWGSGKRRGDAPMTTKALAVELAGRGIVGDERDLYRKVARLLALLPEPSVCSRSMAARVEALRDLAADLAADRGRPAA